MKQNNINKFDEKCVCVCVKSEYWWMEEENRFKLGTCASSTGSLDFMAVCRSGDKNKFMLVKRFQLLLSNAIFYEDKIES